MIHGFKGDGITTGTTDGYRNCRRTIRHSITTDVEPTIENSVGSDGDC